MSSADMSPSDRNRQIRYLLNPKELYQVTAKQIKSLFVRSVTRMADTLGLFYSLCKEKGSRRMDESCYSRKMSELVLLLWLQTNI